MRSKLAAIVPCGRWRCFYIATGSLMAAIVGNPLAPAHAYEGFFEMFGQAWQSLSTSTRSPEGPVDEQGQPLTSVNPWQSYATHRVITAEEWLHFSRLKLPQRRETLLQVIGPPQQANYASAYGYEEHHRFDGKLIEVTYENGFDQRGHAGWVAIAVEVR
jgi:hypothetical protein